MCRNIATRNRLVGCWFAAVAVIVGSMVCDGRERRRQHECDPAHALAGPPVIILGLLASIPPTNGR